MLGPMTVVCNRHADSYDRPDGAAGMETILVVDAFMRVADDAKEEKLNMFDTNDCKLKDLLAPMEELSVASSRFEIDPEF